KPASVVNKTLSRAVFQAMRENLREGIIGKCFVGEHSERRVLVIDATDKMRAGIARVVRDVAAFISDLLHVMSADRSRFSLIGVINVGSVWIRMRNFSDLTDASGRRRTPIV